MTPDLTRRILIAANPPDARGGRHTARLQVRTLLDQTDHLDAIIHLSRELVRLREKPRPVIRQATEHATLRNAFDHFREDPAADPWAVEAIAGVIAGMSDPPTPAQLGTIARHLTHPPDRCKFPATPWEVVAALHRVRDRVSDDMVASVLAFVETFN